MPTIGLKTTISLHLAVLLTAAMLLVDFIIVTTAQRYLIDAEIQQARDIAEGLIFHMCAIGAEHKENDEIPKRYFNGFKKTGNISCAMATTLQGKKMSVSNADVCSQQERLFKLLQNAYATGTPQVNYLETTAGVFWRQNKYLVLSVPVADHPVLSGIVLVKSLDEIYTRLRKMNKVVFVYIGINTILFTLIGLSRLSRSTVRPLKKLVKLSKEYKEDHEIFSLIGRQTNEFRMLSSSLSQMLKKITEDKRKLRNAVKMLEVRNNELKKAQKKIIRAEKLASVGRLSAGIAHEIGNPISIVLGYIGLMKQETLSNEQRMDFLIRTEAEINRIHTIIGHLLDLSRPGLEKQQVVSIHQVLDDLGAVIKVQPLMTNISMTIEMGATHDRVVGNADQYRQVFLNLLINAADAVSSYREKGTGTIRIRTENWIGDDAADVYKNGVIRITIVDNGPGIEDEEIENIFDPFYTTKSPGKGTGLGLSVSYMIVERFGGAMTVESTSGVETKFHIDLPLQEHEEESTFYGKGSEA